MQLLGRTLFVLSLAVPVGAQSINVDLTHDVRACLWPEAVTEHSQRDGDGDENSTPAGSVHGTSST